MKRLIQALATTADGAFAVDSSRQILFWNSAAATLTGFSQAEVQGIACHAIVGGTDELGRPVRCVQCRMGAAGTPVTNVDTVIRTKRDGQRWVNMSTLIYTTEEKETILVHLFRDATRKKQREQFIQALRTSMESLQVEGQAKVAQRSFLLRHEALTPREHEVLVLLVRGQSTKEITQTLMISESTARNHIRHILGKLGVHSRLEAVAYATQCGIGTEGASGNWTDDPFVPQK